MTDPSPSDAAPPTAFLPSLGARGRRRAEPRSSIAIAGAGCALAVLGVLIVAGDTGSGSGDDSFNRWPGLVLTALVIAGGFAVLTQMRQGPIATAGTVAVVLGVPPCMLFLTFSDSSLPPWSTEAILMISTFVWVGAYLVGPGRGRPLFLGAALFGTWATILQVTEKLFDLPFTLIESFVYSFNAAFEADDDFSGLGASGGFGGPDLPDPTTVGLLSLGIGLAYVGVSRRLELRGFAGTATPFIVVALPALAVGVLFLGDELGGIGSGLLLTAIGLGLALHGSSVGRRATTWIGGAAGAAGLATFVDDLADDGTIVGLLALACGLILVAGAHLLASELDEPDEMVVTEPSGRFSWRASTTSTTSAAPPPPDLPEPPEPPAAPEL